jgi:membrane carboxypeptidase/penicillin-binding protein PbpC
MVGSLDYWDKAKDGEVNVTTRLRQPGSSFKPIVYAAGFEKGYQPETLLYDVPTNFGPDGSGKDYIPNNYSMNYNGLVDVRKALAGSLNIPAVKMLYLVGVNRAIDFAEKLGFTTLTDRNRYGLSLVLGGAETKLVEQVGAFSAFANDGTMTPVHGIVSVVNSAGDELYKTPSAEQVMDPEVARKINSILSDNNARTFVFGAKTPLFFPDRKVAAKTGTTQDFRDALTVGYTPELAVGVWTGNNDNSQMKQGSDGIYVAAPLFHTFMERELQNLPDTQFQDYQKVTANIPMVTGMRPTDSGNVRYIKIASGKQISAEKAAKMDPGEYRIEGGAHSILYYIDKDQPLNEEAKPNFNDEMLKRWDAGVQGRRN